jgi:hypothetical protein
LGWLRGRDAGLGEILPLLDHALEVNGAAPDPPIMRGVRSAAVREERRHDRVAAIVADRVRTLEAAGLAPVVEGAVALAVTAYPSPWRRHCGELVLSVPRAHLPAAITALGADPSGRALDPSGFPITLVASPATNTTELASIGGAEVHVADAGSLLAATAATLLAGGTHPAIALVDGWMASRAAGAGLTQVFPVGDQARSLEQLLLVIGLEDVTGVTNGDALRSDLTALVESADDQTVAEWTTALRARLGGRRMLDGTTGPIDKALALENLRRARRHAKLSPP